MKRQKGKEAKKPKETGLQNRLLPYSCIIVVATLVAYWPAFNNGILQWDDNLYVTDNRSISSLLNIPLFFKSFFVGNYQPLTMVTYSIIWHFANGAPKLYHIVNIFFHIGNSLLVFYFTYELLKNSTAGLIVGLLFSIHPFHVESVAWIAELKDVQYTFFFFVSLIFYLKYIRQKKTSFYIYSVVAFILSCLSKGQAVALFPTLLLVDYLEKKKPLVNVAEKIPFLVIAIIFGIIAVIAQKTDNTLGDFSKITFPEQLALAAYSFTTYILKIIIPFGLSSFYPYPFMINGKIPSEYWSYLLIIPVTIAALVIAWKKNRLIFFGLSFFIANIILLLQILPVGNCIMADRYTYISSVGLNIILASILIKYIDSDRQVALTVVLCTAYFLFLGIKTYNQTTLWKNDFTLWNNVLTIYPDISSALVLRGCAYNDKGDYEKALADFNHSLALDPKDGLAYFNRGVSKSKLGDFPGAVEDYKAADNLHIAPRYLFNFYVSYGGALANLNKVKDAMSLFDKAIAIDSLNASVYNNRGITKAMAGDIQGALNDFSRAVVLKPDFVEAVANRDKALKTLQQ